LPRLSTPTLTESSSMRCSLSMSGRTARVRKCEEWGVKSEVVAIGEGRLRNNG
jgi:hypothetical protein